MSLQEPNAEVWHYNLWHGYVSTYAVRALYKTGVWDQLRTEQSFCSADDLATSCGVDSHILEGVLNFFTLTHNGLLAKQDGSYLLTERGRSNDYREWIHALSELIDTYGCLETELVPALGGQKTYGVDFVRNGEALARMSADFLRPVNPWIVGALQRIGARRVGDWCCGAGHTVIAFCQLDPSLLGVGIDIDVGCLTEAKKQIAVAGLQDRIQVLQGDITRPDTYASKLGDIDAFVCVAGFHEFLRNGEGPVIELFGELKKLFPGRHLILVEFDTPSDDEVLARPDVDRMEPAYYQHFIHYLSLQGLPMSRQKWLSLFERAGVETVETGEPMPNWAGYVVRL